MAKSQWSIMTQQIESTIGKMCVAPRWCMPSIVQDPSIELDDKPWNEFVGDVVTMTYVRQVYP